MAQAQYKKTLFNGRLLSAINIVKALQANPSGLSGRTLCEATNLQRGHREYLCKLLRKQGLVVNMKPSGKSRDPLRGQGYKLVHQSVYLLDIMKALGFQFETELENKLASWADVTEV